MQKTIRYKQFVRRCLLLAAVFLVLYLFMASRLQGRQEEETKGADYTPAVAL